MLALYKKERDPTTKDQIWQQKNKVLSKNLSRTDIFADVGRFTQLFIRGFLEVVKQKVSIF